MEDVTGPLPPLGEGARASIPITTRLSIEIPKPKDWQAFQRNCVLLFRAELNDPHAQEYGRSGQKQGGIDILGRRDGNDGQFVGVQCRLIVKPLKGSKILADARSALGLVADLKELIFATTAPDDTGAADAAIAATNALKDEGHDLKIIVYGWGQLQTLIAPHDVAYAAFHPSAVARLTEQTVTSNVDAAELARLVAAQVMERMRGAGVTAIPLDSTPTSDEDPALHARIDTFRDLYRDHREIASAERGLLTILEQDDLSAKPWARYRIETNLGAIAIDLGRQHEAAIRFEAAQEIRPDDPNALASLALARTIQGRFEEAMTLARKALESEPRADQAVGYLLQAAARSDWEGDPEDLIPDDLRGSSHADMGLAEFLRRREMPGWAERSLTMARRHLEMPEFQRLRAVAILSLAIDSGAMIPGGHGLVSSVELNAAADDMKVWVEQCLAVGFADPHDLTVHLNNAAVLLRLCERHVESEAILVRGIPSADDEPQLRRLLALSLSAQDRDEEAVAALQGDADPENQILRAELQAAAGDVAGALREALAIDAKLPEKLDRQRWRVIGELSVRQDDEANLATAIAGLRAFDPHDISASLLEIRGERKTVADEESTRERLRDLAASVPADLSMVSRYRLASELKHQDLPEEASRLLEGHVDLTRPSPSTELFLECLATARRDAAFLAALDDISREVRNSPATLWTVAAHSWNLGDLSASMVALEALLAQEPDEPRARLLKIEILVRQDRSAELFEELEKPLERLAWKRPSDQFRLASLLGYFGFMERAADFAYRLFLQHRDLSRAWMTLSMLVLEEGRGEENTRRPWNASEVASNTAVDLDYDDGSKLFFVVEPDVSLRKLDPVSWEPGHALVQAVDGLRAGQRFEGPDGRKGVIRQIRHKYVARLHYVLKHHEQRFPEIMGFRSIPFDAEEPGGLEGLIEQVKARHDWIAQEESQYLNGPMPIAVLAHRVGMDAIEVANGIASHGAKLKVATGNPEERETASKVVQENAKQGCVLDLMTFWTAWRLGALAALRETCGPIHLPQSVLDQLRSRREQFEFSSRDGHKSVGYEDGKIVLQEIPAEVVRTLRDEVDSAIAWATAHAVVLPVVANDDLPEALRKHLRQGHTDIFDTLILARQSDLLLVTDDLPTRDVDRILGGSGGAWLHVSLSVALEREHIDLDTYVRWTARLIDAGQSYLGVSGRILTHAAILDAAEGTSPGNLFVAVSQEIGGAVAEPRSHIQVTVGCLQAIWDDPLTIACREAVAGHLLRQLVREREGDYQIILRTVLAWTRDQPSLSDYILGWLRGHFFLRPMLDQAGHQKSRKQRISRGKEWSTHGDGAF